MIRVTIAAVAAALLMAGLAAWQGHRANEARDRVRDAEARVEAQRQTIRVLRAHHARLEAERAELAEQAEQAMTGGGDAASAYLRGVLGRLQSD